MDWSKFVWDIDNNGTTSPDITFTAASFASAIVDDTQSTHTITATLTADAKAALDAVDGLGLDGYDADRTDDTESANAADAIDIAAGLLLMMQAMLQLLMVRMHRLLITLMIQIQVL